MSWTAFLLAYLFGGVTFLPLAVAVVFAHAYYTFPYREDADPNPKKEKNGVVANGSAGDDIVQPGDDVGALKAAQKDEAAKPQTSHHEPDVAAGYFAVCREYKPMGINAKPIERATPVGSATVAAPSPSVYQTMYRSIFDRKQTPGPLDNHNNNGSQRPKKAGNVFYVVLRHGHLMLFDDDEQLEVRHVISLAHHNIKLYSGEEPTPEGELFIKRNAICLSRKTDGSELTPDSQLSKPFFLFSDNCSAKEDFYFAMLRNQEQSPASGKKVPTPLPFEVRNIISLVQKLHSSEEHMQTRWLNAVIGRIFLGIYKTKDLENFIREKLTKKISRVKRPSFLSNIAIKTIDTGESAPYITNPRLRDLTVEGECGIEVDVRYTGNFRLEVAATARIDLGGRFKVREVNLVLAVVVRRLEGHMLFKIKPPPSNRIWFSFQQMPKIDLTIEPIVSSRQITYTVILRQIENRIKEVIAESLVLPYWDDVAFFRTEHKKWRGGIFKDDTVAPPSTPGLNVGQDGEVDEVDRVEENHVIQESELPPIEKSHSAPVIEATNPAPTGLFGRKLKASKSKTNLSSSASVASASSTSIEIKNDSTPRAARSASLVQPSAPTVGTDATNADIFKPSSSPPNESPAVTAMATLSAKSSQSGTGTPTPAPASSAASVASAASAASASGRSAFKPYITSKSSNNSSSSSREATDTERDTENITLPRRNTASSIHSLNENAEPSPHQANTFPGKETARKPLTRGLFGRRENSHNGTPSSGPTSPALNEAQRRTALAAVTNAAASARRWGLNALQRHNEGGPGRNGAAGENEEPPLDLNQPIGRGRPLPPPGQPLPMPDKRTKTAPIPVPKRKPVPPPLPERKPPASAGADGALPAVDEATASLPPQIPQRRPVPPPPLPKRRLPEMFPPPQDADADGDNLLVVAAPAPDSSEPTTPLSTGEPGYVQPWVEDGDDELDMSMGVEMEEDSLRNKREHDIDIGEDAAMTPQGDYYGEHMHVSLPQEQEEQEEGEYGGAESRRGFEVEERAVFTVEEVQEEEEREGEEQEEEEELLIEYDEHGAGHMGSGLGFHQNNGEGIPDADDEFTEWMDNPGPPEGEEEEEGGPIDTGAEHPFKAASEAEIEAVSH